LKFYDIDALEGPCGTDNKYKIAALVAARARWLSEQRTIVDASPENEKFLSAALLEIEEGNLPADWVTGAELPKAAKAVKPAKSAKSVKPRKGKEEEKGKEETIPDA
jgi:DNA-directed RNA polymerase subunit K/omega